MASEARPIIQSMGNSLTSISSLTTLPPSPLAHRTLSAHIGAVSGTRPTDLQVDPLGLNDSEIGAVENDGPASTPGSVPSPKPRFAHLHASAPLHPRLPRPVSSPSWKGPRIPSPLNPASRHLKPAPTPFPNPIDGSVPNPRPTRLLVSPSCHPTSPPTTAAPILLHLDPAQRCPPRLRNGGKESAPRKISPSGLNAQLGSALPVTQLTAETKEVDPTYDKISQNSDTRAPSSFSTFVASIESLR